MPEPVFYFYSFLLYRPRQHVGASGVTYTLLKANADNPNIKNELNKQIKAKTEHNTL